MSQTKVDLSQVNGLNGQSLETQLQKLDYSASYKVVVFVVPGLIKQGTQKIELRFPFVGSIESIYAACVTPGTTDTTVQIQKCTQDFIDGIIETPGWVNVLNDVLVIPADKKSSSSATIQPTFAQTAVEINEHFRINILQAGTSSKDLTIEIKIKLN